jgi:hypothetical protein
LLHFLPHLLADASHCTEISELPLGLVAGGLPIPALTGEVFGFGFQVESQFVIHVGRWIGTPTGFYIARFRNLPGGPRSRDFLRGYG